MVGLLTCPKHNHITADNRTLAVRADMLEPSRKPGREKSVEVVQANGEELSDAAKDHDTANGQIDESAGEKTRSAIITQRTRAQSWRSRCHLGSDERPSANEDINVQNVGKIHRRLDEVEQGGRRAVKSTADDCYSLLVVATRIVIGLIVGAGPQVRDKKI